MTTTDDAVSRLLWLLKRHLTLVVVGVLAFAGLGALLELTEAELPYRAESLVVAQDLEALEVEQLPRMAETVFAGGNVARTAVAEGGLSIEPTELIPGYASVEPIEGTLLVRVVGTAASPRLAADISNAAAEALTTELNRAGPTVALFAIQEAAIPPSTRIEGPREYLVLLGAVAGLFVALGLITLIAAVQRPILSLSALRERTDAPALAGPSLPPPGHAVDLVQTSGLAAIVEHLYPDESTARAFVSCTRDGAWRSQMALATALLLARRGPVSFVSSSEHGAARLYREALSTGDTGLRKNLILVGALDEASMDHPVVIDGLSAGRHDVPQLLPHAAQAVLVVPQGSAASAVDDALLQFTPGDVAAVVFLPQRPSALRRLSRRRREEPRSPADPVEPTDDKGAVRDSSARAERRS